MQLVNHVGMMQKIRLQDPALILLSLMAVFSSAFADPIPEGGQDLLASSTPVDWRVMGEDVYAKVVQVDHSEVKTALAVNTLKKPGNHYNHQLIFPVVSGIGKQDTVLISFWARATRTTDESGIGRMSVYLQKGSKLSGFGFRRRKGEVT